MVGVLQCHVSLWACIFYKKGQKTMKSKTFLRKLKSAGFTIQYMKDILPPHVSEAILTKKTVPLAAWILLPEEMKLKIKEVN